MKKMSFVVLLCCCISAFAETTDQQLTAEILVRINQYRVQHGLSKLTLSPILSHQAMSHSIAMAQHEVPFGHDGFGQRMQALHEKIPHSLSGAENVAFNYKNAKIVAEGWLHSTGHRHNIMGNYNLTGIGIARDKAGKLYFTQMFLKG